MTTKDVDLDDALDTLKNVEEDLYLVANVLERTGASKLTYRPADRRLARLAPLAVELARRVNELHASIKRG